MVCRQLGVSADPPELSARTSFWLESYGIASRCRGQSMGGVAPISPLAMLDLSDRLGWPCDGDELISVLCAIDDEVMANSS